MKRYSRDTTTDEVLEGVDLTGKHFLVTGSSSGLGEESARALSSKGAVVIMASRDSQDQDAAARLWKASEDWVGEVFDL